MGELPTDTLIETMHLEQLRVSIQPHFCRADEQRQLTTSGSVVGEVHAGMYRIFSNNKTSA